MTLKLIHSQTTHRGNHREQNEDSCENKKTRNGHLFVTCDGMGGAAEGKKASSIAVKSVMEFFEKETYENIQIALYQSLQFTNEQIYASAQTNPAYKGMGTTACIVLFRNDEMYFAHVGDSRIYQQTNGKLKNLTRDHSFVNQLVDQGTIKPAEAKTHPEKNRILKALGVHNQVEPTVSSQSTLLKKGDIVLLCSDGLTDMVSDASIAETLNEEKNIVEKTDLQLQKALDNGGKDNITLQLIEITESPHTKTVFIDKTPKNLADTLIGEEGTVNGIKYKFSKKHLFIAIPVLILLGWFLVSYWGRTVGDKNGELVDKTAQIDATKIKKWEAMPDSVKIAIETSETEKTVDSISTIEFLFDIGKDSLVELNNGKEEFKLGEMVCLRKKREGEDGQKAIEHLKEKTDSGDNSGKKPETKITLPEYVTLKYGEYDHKKDVFNNVADILNKYPSITKKYILTINSKEKDDFKAGERIYLTQEYYNAAHPEKSSEQIVVGGNKSEENEISSESDTIKEVNAKLKKWTKHHEFITVGEEVNEEDGMIIRPYQATKVSGKKIGELLKINGNISQDDFNKLEIIYLTEKAYKNKDNK